MLKSFLLHVLSFTKYSHVDCSNLSSLIIGSHCMNIATKFILESISYLLFFIS